MNVLNLLAEKNLIDKSEISSIEREIAENEISLEQALIKRGINTEDILEVQAEYFGVPAWKVEETTQIPYEVLQFIPEKSVTHYKILPLGVKDGVLEVGFVDPDNLEARDAIQFIASKKQLPYKIFLISEGFFNKQREVYGGLSGEVSKALTELESELSADEQEISKDISDISADREKITSGEATRIKEDAPVTKIVATILRYAIEGRASDVHIEPLDNFIRVRFRVDGIMHTSLRLPPKVKRAVAARIKILSNMKLDERRKPQDGRFSAHIDDRKIDFRVSTFPTYYGEKVVMRILDPEKGVISLDNLGMTERNLKIVKDSIKRPYGLILISGPTGSGKSTTLYSMLNEVDKQTKNVLSLENPIEYNIPGVSQSQIHPEIDYTFANGLRTTLRQDPDIIMVGEIRDKETAQLAVQAALTGHLVLSTIHTNNSVGVIPRLIDMGVDPYLIAPTLIVALAQRLVRTLCPDSGKTIPVEGSLKIMIDKQFADLPESARKTFTIPETIKGIEPGPDCPNGTRGRMAVIEVLKMTKEIEGILLSSPNEIEIYKKAREQGLITMKEDGFLKAFEGKIPFEEINTL